MAKVKLNSLLADLRGKIGSTVFSSNASGFYASLPKTPRQPRTTMQSEYRNAFSYLSAAWTDVSVSDKALWTTYAERADNARLDWFGDTYYPSSRNQFISLNLCRLMAGESATETPPTSDLPLALPEMGGMYSPENDPDVSFVTNMDSFDASIEYVHVMLSAWPRPGRLSPVLPARFIAIIPTNLFPDVDISPVSSVLFPLSGQDGRWYMEFRPVSADFRVATARTATAAFNESGTG